MNIQGDTSPGVETCRDEPDTPGSNDSGENARCFIEERDYDTFIDGDAQKPQIKKSAINNSATATTYYSTNLASKNNSTGENYKGTSCQISSRD
jgi:hypothetical protein